MKWLSLSVGYAHQTLGGTEMFVHRMNLALRARGIESLSAYYADQPQRSTFEGVPIIGLKRPEGYRSRMEQWGCAPQGLDQFQSLLHEVRPDIVHFHGTLQNHAPEYFEAAKASGARTLWTYHAPGQSCLQTALLRDGTEPCDGRIDDERCTRCCLVWSHLPRPAAAFFSKVDLSGLAPLMPNRARHPFERRAGTKLFRQRFERALRALDLSITCSRWPAELLAQNGVPRSKIFQLLLPPPNFDDLTPSTEAWNGLPGEVRLLFAGRMIDIKGAHVLLEALRGPLANENLAVALLGAPNNSPYGQVLQGLIEREPRAKLVTHMGPEQTLAAMAAAQIVVVPSIWLETGPYTVIEALWTGARVAGSDRAGILERLADEPESALFKTGSASHLAHAIRSLLSRPQADSSRPNRAAAYRARYRHSFDALLDQLIDHLRSRQPFSAKHGAL